MKKLIEGKCGLYGVHLPLDMHPEVGNNAELVRLLELKDRQTFGRYMGNDIGYIGVFEPSMEISRVSARLEEILGVPLLRTFPNGPENAKRVAVVSGLGIPMIDQVESAGCDTYITGETGHNFYHEAVDRRLNVLYGGHYATETLGVKAVAEHLKEKFDLEAVFLDIPTGL